MYVFYILVVGLGSPHTNASLIFFRAHALPCIVVSWWQVQARAVENRVFVVHANVPAPSVADLEAGGSRELGSHGMSRVVDPLGRVMQEASLDQVDYCVYQTHGMIASFSKLFCCRPSFSSST